MMLPVQKTIFTAAVICSSSLASATVTRFSTVIASVQADSTDFSIEPPYFETVFNANGMAVTAERALAAVEGAANTKSACALSTGALKSISAASASGNGGTIYGFGRADFGDSFRAVTGSGPFTWSAADEATFNVDLSGTVQRTGTGEFFNDSAFGLTILEPGALDAYTRWVAGDTAAYAEWHDRVITQSTFSLDSDEPVAGNGIITEFPASIDITFNPAGDFDWVATLLTTAYVNGDFASANASVTADFFNTAQLGYTGPIGTTTLSASGLFPGTTLIPEPASLGVTLIAAGTSLRRRR